jgi:transcriptional regulator GlxA family with amidase domain/YHS domain-containing protein
MQRRELLRLTASWGLASGLLRTASLAAAEEKPLRPPAAGQIPVAFLVSEEAVVIDFAGPWEVFDNVSLPGPTPQPFKLFTVAESLAPIRASGGMRIVPDYSLASAPAPKIVVIPAQSNASAAALDWIRQTAKSADLVMSVCTGAFILAKTGLLAGKSATTHHGAYADFAQAYPNVVLDRGARYVEVDNLATSGGLSSGIDLALRVVERYFGRSVAQSTAYMLEYQGLGWRDPASNAEYAKPLASSADHPRCPVCGMDVDLTLKSVYQGQTYYFCMPAHQRLFDSTPAQFAHAS